MKKTYKSSLLALSVLASFTSCSESESLQQANLSKDKITFHATLDNSWKPLSPASSSRAAIAAATEKGPIVVPTPFGKPLYLHPVVQDGIHIWSKEGKPITRSGAPLEDVEHERVAQTRGSMKDNIGAYGSFGVTAIYKNGENNVSLFQEENGNPKIAVATSTNEDKVWEIKDSRWPVGSEVSFHAFAPYSAGSTSPLGFTPDVDGEKTQIKYTALTGVDEIKAQPDLILATAKGSQSDNALDLNFNHALTAVTFAIDKDLADVLGAGKKLTSITLSGIPNEGTYELAVMKGEGNAAPEWQFARDGGSYKTGIYTFDLKDQNIVTGKDFALTSDNNTLMMIPQTLPESAKLNFQFELDGVLQSLIIDMKDQVWQPGKSVIYKLSASAINTLSNPQVIFPDNTEWAKVGYPKSSFEDGDAIGLYAVSKDGKVVIPNVKLTKGQDGNWKTENDQRFLFTTNYSYFAYYPYRNTPDPLNVNVKATTADDFFKDMITNWNPVKEQKTEDVLLRQDLQVGEGVIDNDAATLTFNMAHSMGLAVLNLDNKEIPKTRRFKNNNYTYYYPDLPGRVTTEPTKGTDYTDDNTKQTVRASNNFLGNIPCSSKITAYRYFQIVKPSTNVSFKASDESGNPRSAWGTHTSYTFNVAQNAAMTKSIITDADFYYLARKYDCTRNVETFTALEDGAYTLECWGAQGHNFNNNQGVYLEGGKGGYVTGGYTMNKGTSIYICVGGYDNGYNNRIPNVNKPGSAGGGATSITTTGRGVLSMFNNYRREVLLVAGGGGAQDAGEGAPVAGVGGGETGASGTGGSASYGTGGTQTGPGSNVLRNSKNCPKNYKAGFGYGGVACIRDSSRKDDYGAHGGGGYYGGGGSQQSGPAGGGSSYWKGVGVTSGSTIDGAHSQPSPDGDKQQIGQSGSGHCVVSWFLK